MKIQREYNIGDIIFIVPRHDKEIGMNQKIDENILRITEIVYSASEIRKRCLAHCLGSAPVAAIVGIARERGGAEGGWVGLVDDYYYIVL